MQQNFEMGPTETNPGSDLQKKKENANKMNKKFKISDLPTHSDE